MLAGTGLDLQIKKKKSTKYKTCLLKVDVKKEKDHNFLLNGSYSTLQGPIHQEALVLDSLQFSLLISETERRSKAQCRINEKTEHNVFFTTITPVKQKVSIVP